MRRNLLKNKLFAVGLVLTGVASVILSGGDATFLVFCLIVGVPLFFAKKNWITP